MKLFIRLFLICGIIGLHHHRMAAQDTTRVLIINRMDTTSRPVGYKCVIDSLAHGEGMYFKWVSSGCFHRIEDSIYVLKTTTGFMVKHNSKTKNISSQDANVIRDFEYQVYKLSKIFGGCTTTEYFIYKRKNKTYTAGKDGTCNYDVFTWMLNKLGI